MHENKNNKITALVLNMFKSSRLKLFTAAGCLEECSATEKLHRAEISLSVRRIKY